MENKTLSDFLEKYEGIDKVSSLLDEMNENQIKQYMKTYLESGGKAAAFFKCFGEYIDRLEKDSNGLKRMSKNGFKMFLLKIDSVDDYIRNSITEMGKLAEESWKINKIGEKKLISEVSKDE